MQVWNPYTPTMPYNPYPAPAVAPAQHYEIIQVNGKAGVDAFQMGPNSRVLLLDETQPLVWLAQTDGAGYKTATPYTLTPYQAAPPVDLDSLVKRLTKLEENYEQLQSNIRPNKQNKRQPTNEQNNAATTAG